MTEFSDLLGVLPDHIAYMAIECVEVNRGLPPQHRVEVEQDRGTVHCVLYGTGRPVLISFYPAAMRILWNSETSENETQRIPRQWVLKQGGEFATLFEACTAAMQERVG